MSNFVIFTLKYVTQQNLSPKLNYQFKAVYFTNVILTLHLLFCENLKAFYRILHYKKAVLSQRRKQV
jgi:hypothetical protein